MLLGPRLPNASHPCQEAKLNLSDIFLTQIWRKIISYKKLTAIVIHRRSRQPAPRKRSRFTWMALWLALVTTICGRSLRTTKTPHCNRAFMRLRIIQMEDALR